MTLNLRNSVRTGLNPGLRQSISGGVDSLGLFRSASLDLRFADKKTLTDRVSGTNLITFSRASSGTYVGSDGLIKTSAVNKLLYSNEFTNAAWTQSGLTLVSSTTTAPDGTATATTFSAPNDAYILQDTSSVIGQPYVNSIWIKGSVNATLGLRIPGRNNSAIGSDGTVALNVTTEWQKFTSATTSAENPQGRFLLDFRSSTGASVPAGFEVSLWHAQTEEGTTATDYIPTGATIGGAPRFDHDPVTGESLGLLVEEQRTNLITSSSDIAGFFTQQNSTATADAAAAPDGTVTADLLVPHTSSSTHGSFNNTSLSFSASTTYSYSIFVKPNGYSWIQLLLTSGFNNLTAWVNFDLTGAGSFGFTGGGEISKEIESHPGGWYRCTITARSGASAFAGGPAYLVLDSNRNGRDEHYAGDGTSGIYLWGAQLEEGSFPTSYIPTTTSTVTRSPDIASIEGTNFSSWFNQSEGTVFSDVASKGVSGIDVAFAIGSSNDEDRWLQQYFEISGVFYEYEQGAPPAHSYTNGSYIKSAIGRSQGDNAVGLNGSIVQSDTYSGSYSPVFLKIGVSGDPTRVFNGHISRLAYFPVRKTDQELIDLTKS
jgi:hypothetical protein